MKTSQTTGEGVTVRPRKADRLPDYACVLGLVAIAVTLAAPAAYPSGAGIYPEALRQANVELDSLTSPINDALIIGNGDLNALVFAEGDDLVIRITKNDVWDARLDSPLDPPLPTLKRLLELKDRDWKSDDRILPEGSEWKWPDSYHAHAYPCPRACAVLRVKGAARGKYTATLSIDTAAVEVRGNHGAYRIYVPAELNAVMVEVTGGDSPLTVELEPIRSDDIPEPEIDRGAGEQCIKQSLPGDADWPGMQFAVAAKTDSGKCAAAVVCTSLEAGECLAAAKQMTVLAVSGRETLLKAHQEIWARFWSRSGVELPDALLQSVWYRNLYFLRCVSKPGVVSTGLFAGLLNDKPEWHGDYHTNYNIQQTYWGAFAANQCDLAEPYDRLMTEYLPRARWLARQIFELEGAYFPHVMFAYEPPDPAQCKSPNGRQYIHHVWGMTQGVNGFSVQPLWWHYKYEPSRAFLETVAYPAVRDVADFQAAFVERCERVGDRIVLGPSVSPEHWAWTRQFERNRNCAFDIAMFRFIFNAAMEGAATLKTDTDRAKRWSNAMALLPDYPIHSGEPRIVVDVEGAPPIEYNIPVPATPVFPGDVVTWASPAHEQDLFRETLAHLKHNGNNAPIMLAVARARLNTLDAYDFLRNELQQRARRNGTLSFNTIASGHKFNDFGHYTEMFGAVLPVSELVLQSVGGTIRLFPAWPKDKDASFTTMRAEGGFLVSAELRSGLVTAVRLESTAGGEVKLLAPWEKAEISRGTNNAWEPLAMDGKGILRATTKPGDTLALRPAG